MERTGLCKTVLEEIVQIAKIHNLDRVILFGSRARGDCHSKSDIDLAVNGGDTINFSIDLEENVNTLLTFDVVDLGKGISDSLLGSIEKDGVVIYEKFENYVSNLAVLEKAYREDLNNEFIVSGIIDKFFIQFELGWKVLEELLRYEGKSIANTGSPREIIKAAYSVYDFINEEPWLSMLRARNDMTHIYDGNAAKELVDKILKEYIPEFQHLKDEILVHYDGNMDLF